MTSEQNSNKPKTSQPGQRNKINNQFAIGHSSPINVIGSKEVTMRDGFSNAIGIRSPHDWQNETFKQQYHQEGSAHLHNSNS
jgi:hypothetical protein